MHIDFISSESELDYNEVIDIIIDANDLVENIISKISKELDQYKQFDTIITSVEMAITFEQCLKGFISKTEEPEKDLDQATDAELDDHIRKFLSIQFRGWLPNWKLYYWIELPPNKIYLCKMVDDNIVEDNKLFTLVGFLDY